MKKAPGTITLTMDEQDFGTICVCALRYAMGRQTYMPQLVMDFVRPLLPKLPYKTIAVMDNDCKFQNSMDMYGDDDIDKPGWLKWARDVKAEKERRDAETHL